MTEKEIIISKLKKELRGIISTALNRRSDTKRLRDLGAGIYIHENTATMTEIEAAILDFLDTIK